MISGDDPTAHQLRLALVLAEELHFGRAAARLYLTQPALSQQVRSLEQRLGVTLFTRTSRRVEPTDEGRSLFPLLRRALEAHDELRQTAETIAQDGARLRVGVCESFAALGPTRDVIAELARDQHGIGPDVHVADSFTEQMQALTSGRVDAVFVYLPVPGDLRTCPLTTEPRMLCVSADDPLASRPSTRLAELADREVLSLATSFSAGRRFWMVDPRPDGSTPRMMDEQVMRFDSLLSVIAVSSAVAFVPSSAADLYPRPDVAYVPVDDLAPCTLAAVWLPDGDGEPKIAVLEQACHRSSGERLGTAES